MNAPAPAPIPAAGRGATRIADQAVAKIAVQAAREALSSAPQAHLVPADRRPQAAAAVRPGSGSTGDGGSARVRLSVELGYPVDIRTVCAAVRAHVVERIEQLAGLSVPEVSVLVERLHSSTGGPADSRRVR